MHRLHRVEAGLPPRRPDREHERQPGPRLPLRAEVHPHRDTAPRAASSSAASPITSTASCGSPASASRSAASARAVANRGRTPQRWRQSSSSSSTEVRDDAVSSTVRPSSSVDRPPGEERHAVHRAVAGDGEVGQQVIRRRVPGVLDRGDDAHLQLARGEQVVELGRGAGHQLRRHAHQAPVDRAVDRIAVDPGNPAEPHAACTTGSAAPAAQRRAPAADRRTARAPAGRGCRARPAASPPRGSAAPARGRACASAVCAPASW